MAAKAGDRARNQITGLDQYDLPLSGLDAEPEFGRWDEFEGEQDGKPFSHQIRWHGPKGQAITTLWKDGWYSVANAATGEIVLNIDMTRQTGA